MEFYWGGMYVVVSWHVVFGLVSIVVAAGAGAAFVIWWFFNWLGDRSC